MNLLGYPRFTGDIDILLALDDKNLARMAKLMKNMKYEQRVPAHKKKHLIAYTFFNPSEPLFSIDVIVGASLKFRDYEKHCMHIAVWDISIPVVSIDDLIGMKKKSNRKKDAEDITALLEITGMNPRARPNGRCPGGQALDSFFRCQASGNQTIAFAS